MNPNDNGGPAFPVEVDGAQPDGRQTGNTVWQTYGMTLRDYFAGQVVSGESQGSPKQRAVLAYEVADAMLKARKP